MSTTQSIELTAYAFFTILLKIHLVLVRISYILFEPVPRKADAKHDEQKIVSKLPGTYYANISKKHSAEDTLVPAALLRGKRGEIFYKIVKICQL